MNLDASTSTFFNQSDSSPIEISSFFWQQWQQNRELLYHCCIKWMEGNPIEAEEALSQAMLKAWEKVQKFAGKINNFKAWLTRLTHNLCVDLHRERSRSANQVEDIEVYTCGEKSEWLGCEDTSLNALESDEKKMAIRRAIENLPTRLRETFILHFYEDRSYQEIAQQQEISVPNTYKRISQARKILRKELKGYFFGEDETKPNQEVASNSLFEPLQQVRSTQSTLAKEEVSIGEKSQVEVEAIPQETVISPIAISVAPQKADTEQSHGQEIQRGQIPCTSGDGGSKVSLPKSCESSVSSLLQKETQQEQHTESESIAIAVTEGKTCEEKSVVAQARNKRCACLNNLAHPGFYDISIESSQVNKQSDISRNPVDTDVVQGYERYVGKFLIYSRSPP